MESMAVKRKLPLHGQSALFLSVCLSLSLSPLYNAAALGGFFRNIPFFPIFALINLL